MLRNFAQENTRKAPARLSPIDTSRPLGNKLTNGVRFIDTVFLAVRPFHATCMRVPGARHHEILLTRLDKHPRTWLAFPYHKKSTRVHAKIGILMHPYISKN